MSMFQFIFYMGWLKVAEALLNPLGKCQVLLLTGHLTLTDLKKWRVFLLPSDPGCFFGSFLSQFVTNRFRLDASPTRPLVLPTLLLRRRR